MTARPLIQVGHEVREMTETEHAQYLASLPPPPTLAELAKAALARINIASSAQIGAIAAQYPDYEVRTWQDQEREARAWAEAPDDAKPPTPTLTEIATMRGLDMTELVARVIAKADAYRSIVAKAVGLRQRLEDAIQAAVAAEDREALEAIQWPQPSEPLGHSPA